MITLPITKQAKQQEWKIIFAVAQNNGFPLHIIHNLKKKLIVKKQIPTTTQQAKKWVMFSYHSPLIQKITNLFKHSNLNIALRATNIIHQQLIDKITKTNTNCSRIYKLKCNTCNNSYVGQDNRADQ
jgi:ribosomal protein L17